MNKYLIAVVVIVFLVDLAFQFYTNKKRNDLLNALSTYLAKKDYESFDKLIEDNKTKRFIPSFNIAYLKLNEAMMKEDMEEIKKAFGAFNMLYISRASISIWALKTKKRPKSTMNCLNR